MLSALGFKFEDFIFQLFGANMGRVYIGLQTFHLFLISQEPLNIVVDFEPADVSIMMIWLGLFWYKCDFQAIRAGVLDLQPVD